MYLICSGRRDLVSVWLSSPVSYKRTIPAQRAREGGSYGEVAPATTWRVVAAGSDQPNQKSDQRKSAEQHGPIAHVERKKTSLSRNLHIRKHVQLCRIAMEWPEWIGPSD
jgi:hypothetical protein